MAQLALIRLPDGEGGGGAAAEVVLTDGRKRQGRVIRRLPDLETGARMARVIVEVRDPLGLFMKGEAPLLLQDYVRVRIEGTELRDVYPIPRTALRDGRVVWLLDGDSRLRLSPVETVWGGETKVLVRGRLPEGARVITSGLAAPVEGMRLRLSSSEDVGTTAAQKEAGPNE